MSAVAIKWFVAGDDGVWFTSPKTEAIEEPIGKYVVVTAG